VDNTAFTPESADYPSAVRALQRAQRPVGVTGAGLIGRCNPAGSNYHVRALGSAWKRALAMRKCPERTQLELQAHAGMWRIWLRVQEFWGAAAGGSWLTVARHSSHTEFFNAGRLLNRVIAALCGCQGRNSPQASLSIPASPHNTCVVQYCCCFLPVSIITCLTAPSVCVVHDTGDDAADSAAAAGLDGVQAQGGGCGSRGARGGLPAACLGRGGCWQH
jgi:hypothetical protein